jgi:hypothetical protein
MLTSHLHPNLPKYTHNTYQQVLSAHLPARDGSVTLSIIRDTDSAEVASRASVSSPLF